MESTTLDKLLGHFDQTVAEIKDLGLPALGPEFATLDSGTLHAALVSHRAQKAWEIPNASYAKQRKEASIQQVLERDKEGLTAFDYRALPKRSRIDFLGAKEWLRNFFHGFQHTYQLRFPTGETFVGAKGMTDLLFKLRDVEQWQCSPDLVDYIVSILERHRGLRAVVKQRFRDKYGEWGRTRLEKLRQQYILMHPGEDSRRLRRTCIKYMFRAVCTLNRTSRVTTVPKDNKNDRVITCESLWTMVAQLSYAASLRAHMRQKLGIDLDSLQNVHRALIRAGAATIDLSAASDRNYMVVLKSLWPEKAYSWLEKMRTGVFEVETPSGTSFHPLRMFAPMGCGCTFEVMTLTLLSHVRTLDKGGSVFGDDIIVKQSEAIRLMDNLHNMGWRINESKSFWTGNFRESCGAFASLETDKLLLSYDWIRPTNLAECFTLAHKMLRVAAALPPGDLKTLLFSRYSALRFLFPRDSLMVIDNVILRESSPLTDNCFYVDKKFYELRFTGRSTPVTRCLETFWHRPIRITTYHTVKQAKMPIRRIADRTLYACYMQRGMVYAPDLNKTRPVQYQIDAFSGVALRNVTLVSII